VVALWAIERAYLEAWRGAAPGSAALREFVDHWTVPAFSDYVVSLERAADAALRTASEKAVTAAENAFEAVARLEADFWDMAWSTPSD